MKIQPRISKLMAFVTIGSLAIVPVLAMAQDGGDHSRHRQDTKNNWRNLAIGSGVLGVIGLVEHNNTLAVAGLVGAAYSANRYEQDRKSQNHDARARANFYSRTSYVHNGHHYHRKTYWDHGQKFYKFVRG